MAQAPPNQELVVGGDFVLKRRIKAGGFGTVYEALQLSTGQPRAVKILHAQLASEDSGAVSRFRIEATAASRVQSAYVVQVIAAGVDASSGPWIAMEYLRGSDLFDWVRVNGPMSWPQARQVLQHLCHALASAHRAGIVHRDLKPENIFLAESSGLEGPFITKILDFGIAKAFEGTSSTTAGIGSWAWLAPEQASAHSRVTPATDVWALGLVAFFLLTAKCYWFAFQEGADGSIVRELGQDHFEAASSRARRLRCPVLLPVGFDEWFAKCVTHTNRFPDASFAGSALPAAPVSSVPAMAHTVPGLNRPPEERYPGRTRSAASPLFGGAGAVLGIGAIALMVAAANRSTSPGSAPAGRVTPVASTAPATPVLPAADVDSRFYTPPLLGAPGCSVDCSSGCEHVLVAAGPAYGFFEDLAHRQRAEMGLCAEVSRLERRPNAPTDQFSYSFWVAKGWQAPAAWRDVIPDTKIPIRADWIRVPEMRAKRVFPPPCSAETLSFTDGARRLVGNSVRQQCELLPPNDASRRGDVWSWNAAGSGSCSCRTSDEELASLRKLGECLLGCNSEPRTPCVDACEASSPDASRP